MTKARNLIGKTFGRLTVVERAGSRNHYALWLCRCSCGITKSVTSNALRQGQQSCGCIRRGMKIRNMKNLKPMEGKIFGRLTVINYVMADKGGKAIWRCICQCGNETRVTGYNLRAGLTRSCGCLRGEKFKLAYGKAAKNLVQRAYWRHAKERGLDWKLTPTEFDEIIKKPCQYCGEGVTNLSMTKSTYGEFTYNGIDRVDNSVGYVSSNIVACCRRCNLMKSNLTKDEFLNHIRRIFINSGLNQ